MKEFSQLTRALCSLGRALAAIFLAVQAFRAGITTDRGMALLAAAAIIDILNDALAYWHFGIEERRP